MPSTSSTKARVRRTKANDRERHRMHQLNDAFDLLRAHIPLEQLPPQPPPPTLHALRSSSECDDSSQVSSTTNSGVTSGRASSPHALKLSKIETIRLAQNYIRTLAGVLAERRQLSALELWHQLVPHMGEGTAQLLRHRVRLDAGLRRQLIVCCDDGGDENGGVLAEEQRRRDG